MKHVVTTIICLTAILLVGCQKEPSLTLSNSESIELPADGGSQAITLTASRSWTATSSDSWVSVSPSSGNASNNPVTVTVAGEQNTTCEDRSATVTIKAEELTKSVTVHQSANLGILLSQKSYELEPEAQSIELKVQANVEYTVLVSDSWIQYVGTKALKSSTILLHVSGNTSGRVREGKVEIVQEGGRKSYIVTIKQAAVSNETRIREALMQIYNKMDGQNWKISKKWDMSQPLENWEGVKWNKQAGKLELYFNGEWGLKGEFPDCFDGLTPLTVFFLQHEPGVTGTLPPSFRQLKNLESLSVNFTSMTSLPDLFMDTPLVNITIAQNNKMNGSIPESLGSSSKLSSLHLERNAFTGTVPDSWARLGTKLLINEEFLDDWVPDSFITAPQADYLVNMYLVSSPRRTAPMNVGDYDIKAYWPSRTIRDIVTGTAIPYKDIVSKNKATVLLNWATWCPYSKQLMPLLKRMYDKYHKDGLEIIASFNASSETADSGKPLKDVILERGYEKWYNFNIWDFSPIESSIWCSSATPSAIVVDNKGVIMKSNRPNVSDPARNRFGHTTSTKLIPILEEIFGSLENEDDYYSTDYSQDGKVLTLQKASVGNGINVVFMGDAYTDKDMAAGGLYETMMRQSMEEFFAIEPYKTYRKRFNVYAVKAVSKNGKTGNGYSTALSTDATFGSISTGNVNKCYEYALKVPGIKNDNNLLIGVLVNSLSSRGITTMSETKQSGVSFYGSCGNDPEAFGNTLRHEAGGHGFAFLDDEYVTKQGAVTQEHINHRNSMYQKYGWFSNVDFTNDPQKIKWSAFLNDARYADEIGIYEGGSLYQKGAYRPSESSIMHDGEEYFNAPSRWAIYQRIMKLSGEEYSFGKFLEYDAVNRNKVKKAGGHRHTDAPPIIVP